MMKKLISVLCLALLLISSLVQASPTVRPADFQSRYQLQEMVVLSRHNIRAPLSGTGSKLGDITPHAWFSWTSDASELSLRGGELETMMGQYFRKRLVQDGLITENYQPADGEVRFYANSRQRTIATAQYFSSGMLPVANVTIEHMFPPGNKVDPVFKPRLTFVSEAFRAEAMQQITAMGGSKGLQGVSDRLAGNYQLLENVLDMKDAKAAKKDKLSKFRTDDLTVKLELNHEPALTGGLKLANEASDAMVLQYYEESDPLKAAFGHELSKRDWEKFGQIKDAYNDLLFTAPIVAVNIAHPLLQVMNDELSLPQRKFTFLCGHDSNIASVLAALEVEPYSLPQSVEKKTPIGVKFVIEKWHGSDGQQYASLSLVYQSVEQLRDRTMLSLATPPMIYPLKLQGLTQNADGLYRLCDVQQRFTAAIAAYDTLPRDLQPAVAK